MATKIEISNFIKIIMDEISCDKNKAKKAFLETIEKMEEVNPDLSFSEWLDECLGKIGIEPEKKNIFKDKILALDPTLNFEEGFRKGIHIAKEFYRIE